MGPPDTPQLHAGVLGVQVPRPCPRSESDTGRGRAIGVFSLLFPVKSHSQVPRGTELGGHSVELGNTGRLASAPPIHPSVHPSQASVALSPAALWPCGCALRCERWRPGSGEALPALSPSRRETLGGRAGLGAGGARPTDMLCGVGVNMLPGTQAELPGPGGPELTCQWRPPCVPRGAGPPGALPGCRPSPASRASLGGTSRCLGRFRVY